MNTKIAYTINDIKILLIKKLQLLIILTKNQFFGIQVLIFYLLEK